MATSTGLATSSSAGQMQKAAAFSFAPTNFSEAIDLAERLSRSNLVPKNFIGKPQDILVAMQMGAEVNLSIMQSLKSIAVINGMPSLYGDGFLAVIQSHPAFEWIKEDNLEDIAKTCKATCTIKRRNAEPHSVTFTREMAQKAGLLNKEGPWKNYEPRQMQMRARGFCGRDTFADALRGMVVAEEAYDVTMADPIPEPAKIQATVVVPTAQPAIEASKPAETAKVEQAAEPQAEEHPATITIDEAKQFYRAYSKSGYLPEESKAYLKEKFSITDSRLMKPEDFETAMKWAETPRVKPDPVAEQPKQEWSGNLPEVDPDDDYPRE